MKRKIEEEYKNYCKLKERLLSFKTDEDARLREMDFLRFEIQEIENGEVKEGEEEELTLKYRRLASKYIQSFSKFYICLLNESQIFHMELKKHAIKFHEVVGCIAGDDTKIGRAHV